MTAALSKLFTFKFALSKENDLLWLLAAPNGANFASECSPCGYESLRREKLTSRASCCKLKQVMFRTHKAKHPAWGRGVSLYKESDDDLLSHG